MITVLSGRVPAPLRHGTRRLRRRLPLARFVATGTVAQALALLDAGRAHLHEDARAAVPREAPLNPPSPQEYPDFDATQGDVLLHVYEELAQHLGQLEVTRDVLLARRP